MILLTPPYDAMNCYWALSGSAVQVWSSASLSFVPVADVTYQAWLANGNVTTVINTGSATTDQGILNSVMELQVLPGILSQGVGFSSISGTQSWSPSTVQFAVNPEAVYTLSGFASSLAISHLPQGGGPIAISGLPTFKVADINGIMHTFSQSQFMAFYASAIDYVTRYSQVVQLNIAGGASVLPTDPVDVDPYTQPLVTALGPTTLGTSGGFIPVDATANHVIIAPPGAPSDGQQVIIADVTGQVSPTNYIQFTGRIDNAANQKLTVPYSWWNLRYYAAQTIWKQVG